MADPSNTVSVVCPYCGELVEVFIEADLRGELVQDCEVCCNPWQLEITGDGTHLRINARRLDD